MRHVRPRAASQGTGGFTRAELLVVIGVIIVLFSVIFIAVDPARRFAQTRNANRREDVRDIAEAVRAYMIDNRGDGPTGLDSLTSGSQVIGTAVSGCDTTCTATTTLSSCLDLGTALAGSFAAEVPEDPKTGTGANTDYFINRTSDGRILVGSCDPELGVLNLFSVR